MWDSIAWDFNAGFFIVYFSRYKMDYLELRLWVGLWMGLILILLVAFDASAFVCYITRFTEENFATLIAFIFMVEVSKDSSLNVVQICRSH